MTHIRRFLDRIRFLFTKQSSRSAKSLTPPIVASLLLLPVFFESGAARNISTRGICLGFLLVAAAWGSLHLNRKQKLLGAALSPVRTYLLESTLVCIYPSNGAFLMALFFGLLSTSLRRSEVTFKAEESRSRLLLALGLNDSTDLPDNRQVPIIASLACLLTAIATLAATSLRPQWSGLVSALPFFAFAVAMASMLTSGNLHTESKQGAPA